MTFPLLLLLAGGFLLGGAWSVWRSDPGTAGRSVSRIFVAGVLLLAALLATAAGVLRLV